jgi:hypothetical protein
MRSAAEPLDVNVLVVAVCASNCRPVARSMNADAARMFDVMRASEYLPDVPSTSR